MNLNKKSKVMILPKINKIIFFIIAIGLIITGLKAYQYYQFAFSPNVKKSGNIIIPNNATYQQVLDSLQKKEIIINEKAFKWVAKKKNYPLNIKTGNYEFKSGMNNNHIVNMLKAGLQKPVSVIINNLRTIEQLAGIVSHYIAPDSVTLLQSLRDTTLIKKLGYNKFTFPVIFIPNTYQVYWTTTPEKFILRMKREYNNFWNEKRKGEAELLGLSPVEVITLASIIQEETNKKKEKPIVAGLYLNRLKKGIPLQSDPTVKFALEDSSVRRILKKYLKIDSPYNTYKYAGLPPGPINFPEISSIESVLHPDSNNYIYMCAKEDFSGYHNFTNNLRTHMNNARKYQRALTKMKIMK
ncbi:MAG: endolytic transglycosylase MltG [Prolixibacteraceae bacterium]|nr:endolytic transglycosylase MltG [Prolixibacteraceae bacterium]